MSRSFINLNYHLVFSTKQREPWLQPDVASRLYPYIGGIIRKDDGCTMAIGGMPDHLHILLSLGVTVPIADTIRNIKALSSGWIHREYPALSEFAWQRAYGLFSVSESRVDVVKDYIHRQVEHHRTKYFKRSSWSSCRNTGLPTIRNTIGIEPSPASRVRSDRLVPLGSVAALRHPTL